MRFEYSARDAGGRPHSGLIDAADTAAALAQLSAQGLMPVQLRAVAAPTAPQRRSRASIKLADQVVLIERLQLLA